MICEMASAAAGEVRQTKRSKGVGGVVGRTFDTRNFEYGIFTPGEDNLGSKVTAVAWWTMWTLNKAVHHGGKSNDQT